MSLMASLGRFFASNPLMLLLDFGPQAVKAWFWFFDYLLYDGDPPDRDGELDEDDDGGLWRYHAFGEIDGMAADSNGRGA